MLWLCLEESWVLVQFIKVVALCHVQAKTAQLTCHWLWLIAPHRPRLVIRLNKVPWSGSEVLSMFGVTQNPLSQLTELASQRHALCVEIRQSEFAGFFKNLLDVKVLLRRLVQWVKCVVMAHVSVLVPHLALVALVLVHQLGLFVNGWVNLHRLTLLFLSDSVAFDFKVDVRTIRSEVFIEDLFATWRHMRIENIKRLAVQLVS